MRHQFFSAAIGLALAAAFLPASATSAQAGDPSGYWRKADQGQHPAKMQLYRCGGRSICVKIVWLQNPRDSKGRELQDVRNVNPSLRGRTIEGMHIIRGMQQTSANQWKGTVYNPEDGKTYSATVTLASSRKIVLKGCVASFLCREQVWLRTSAPPPREEEKKPEPQVEAKAEPEATQARTDTAAGSSASDSKAAASTSSVANAEVLAPAEQQDVQPGYRYLDGAKTKQDPEGFSGESVSSMFSMATPLAPGSAQTATRSAPAPAREAPVQRQAAVPPAPAAEPAPQETETAAPATEPAPSEAAEVPPSEEYSESQTAEETEAGQGERLSWRERRQLRRQRRLKELQAQGQNLIPWLR